MHSLEQELGLVKANLKKQTPAEVTKAYLNLGALCDRIQTMMYRKVFPETFCPENAVFKVKDIEENLSEGGTKARKRWNALQKKLRWDPKRHRDAISNCKRSRNKCAHPDAQLTEKSLTKSVEILEREGHIREDWLSLKVVQELIAMWKTLKK